MGSASNPGTAGRQLGAPGCSPAAAAACGSASAGCVPSPARAKSVQPPCSRQIPSACRRSMAGHTSRQGTCHATYTALSMNMASAGQLLERNGYLARTCSTVRQHWWSLRWQAVPGSGALAWRTTCSLPGFGCHDHSGFLEVHVAAVLGAASASIPEPVVALPYFCRASTPHHNT